MTTQLKDQNSPVEIESKGFVNPYLSAEKTQTISAEFEATDYRFIQGIRPKQGTVTTTMSLLWKQLCYELRIRGIATWEDGGIEQFEKFMQHFRIVPTDELKSGGGLPYGTVGGIVGPPSASNVGPGVAGVCPDGKGVENEPSDIPKQRGKDGKGKRTNKGKETGD